jgi:hypothetical protein
MICKPEAQQLNRAGSSLPLRRSEDPSSFCESVAGDSDASHGVGCSLESCERQSIKRIGLPDPTSSRGFQRLGGFPLAPSPVPLRVRVHPLVSFASSTEYVAACHLPGTRAEHLPWGFVPIRDTSVRSPLTTGFPRPGYVPPSAFLALSAVCSSTHRVGLFHPTATFGIHTSGDFPAAQPARLISESCPPVVAEILLTAGCPAAARSTRPAFRALVRAAIRCGRQVV